MTQKVLRFWMDRRIAVINCAFTTLTVASGIWQVRRLGRCKGYPMRLPIMDLRFFIITHLDSCKTCGDEIGAQATT
jgi:hypothetical protein